MTPTNLQRGEKKVLVMRKVRAHTLVCFHFGSGPEVWGSDNLVATGERS